MSNDELRKKCFELECALGKAIKVGAMQQDELKKAAQFNSKLSDVVSTLTVAIRTYVDTMDKKYLLNAIDVTHAILKGNGKETVL
jgi:hypothetical protein